MNNNPLINKLTEDEKAEFIGCMNRVRELSAKVSGRQIPDETIAQPFNKDAREALPTPAPSIFGPKLIKPNKQTINSVNIKWIWDLPGSGHLLTATFYKKDSLYEIDLYTEIDSSIVTAEDAIIIGNALRSAGEWKEVWRKHVGELMFVEDHNDDDGDNNDDDELESDEFEPKRFS